MSNGYDTAFHEHLSSLCYHLPKGLGFDEGSPYRSRSRDAIIKLYVIIGLYKDVGGKDEQARPSGEDRSGSHDNTYITTQWNQPLSM